MSVVSFTGAVPVARYDGLPWTHVRIEEATVAGGPYTARETQLLSPVDSDPAHPVARSLTTSLATLSAGWYRLVFTDAASDESTTNPIYSGAVSTAPMLISLDQLKTALGLELIDTTRDARLTQAIVNATSAIHTFTDRDFASPWVTEGRTYAYDGSGVLEIDDCLMGSISSVTLNGLVQASDTWIAEPDRRSPVHYWLQLPSGGYAISPAMGFTYNLDVLYPKVATRPQAVVVAATWGWPEVPADVQQAAVYTASALNESPKPYVSQSFESYSVQQVTPLVDAIPERAQSLLNPYQRIRL